jgi:hypothetical protein
LGSIASGTELGITLAIVVAPRIDTDVTGLAEDLVHALRERV